MSSLSPLAQSYAKMYAGCVIRPEREKEVAAEVRRMVANQVRYEQVAKEFAGMPWWVPAVLHSMECGLNFGQHLHNGNSLKARTVDVPAGRPVKGRPPFTWEESAEDALRFDEVYLNKDWSAGMALVVFENYNGTGYRRRGVVSPYLWSFTTAYVKGKYGEDGKYSPELVSQQCGCAVLLKGLGVK